ncbi:MAG TPA: histidine kinase [Conexibacter sp.]|nr:histidine kinase [Conexibacter sp.]
MPLIAVAVVALAASELPWSPTEVALLATAVAGFTVWALTDRPHVAPLALLLLAIVIGLKRDGQFDAVLFLMSLTAAMAAAWSPTRADLVISLAVVVSAPLLVFTIDPRDIEWEIWLMGVTLPAALSWLFGRQAQLVEQLAATRQELMVRDREQERLRVAREVHDVVARGLAVMLVQVGSARHVIRRDVEEAEHALLSAEAAGRESLAELRATIAALRQPTAAGSAGGEPAGELARAAVEARIHGLDAHLTIDGDPAGIGREAGATLVRVAQEALVNAAKHAPGARTSIVLRLRGRVVTLDVRSSDAGAGARAGRADGTSAPGYGLLGMRERVEAVGGTLVAGPDAGDWLVRCALPLNADAPDAAIGGASVRVG